ncbi:hypothetical protein ABKV19_023673 [Rosa sericea]
MSAEQDSSSTSQPQVKEKFPHIKDYREFRPSPDLDVKPLLKAQLAVATFS